MSIQRLKVENSKLQKELAYTHNLLRSANSIILRWDKDGIIQFMNDFGLHFFGYSSEELIGQHIMTIVPKVKKSSGRDMSELAKDIAKNPDKYISVPSENITKDGRTVWVAWTNKGVFDEQGKVQTFFAIGNDITELKKCKMELKQALQFNELIISNSPAGLLVFKESGPCVMANTAATKITGGSHEELFKLNYRESESCLKTGILADIEETLRAGSVIKNEINIKNTFGKEVWFDGIISTFQNYDEKHILFLFHDILERKQAEKDREKLISNLQDKTKEMESLIYTITHDLKTPLITISGFLDIIKQDLVSGKDVDLKTHLSIVDNATKRMKQLVDELLEFSQAGSKRNPQVTVSLGTLITEAIENHRGLISKSNAIIEVAPELPDVTVDQPRLLRVIENLVANAIKYSSSQKCVPFVNIGASRSEGEITCYVKDNGIGIDPKNFTRVFELFERLDSDSDGTGVGLAIVKRIIEVHGGKVWVESEGLGHGTTFFFTLPEAKQ